MNNEMARENILQKIKEANNLIDKTELAELDFKNVYFDNINSKNKLNIFVNNFTQLLGTFIQPVNTAALSWELNKLVSLKKWTKIFCQEKVIINLIIEANLEHLISNDLASCDVSFTPCDLAIARTGTIVLSSALTYGRTSSVFAPEHLGFIKETDIVENEIMAFEKIKNLYPDSLPSCLSFASGPSRTADIEKTLVVGIHGPKNVYLCLLP